MARNAGSSRVRPGTWSLIALVVWTLYVWSTRISNAAGDAALSRGSKAFSIGLSLTFVALAVAGVAVLVRSWSRRRSAAEIVVLRVFAGWTVVVWLVRVPMILVADHVVGFKVVHAMLGLISIGLAALVWRSTMTAAVDADTESLQSTPAR
jgi:hypothetical protein